MPYLLGIDLGTSALKSVLFDECGRSIAQSSRGYPMYQAQNGWAEQDPQHWWQACVDTVQELLKESQIRPQEILSIGISGQMHGLIMLDKMGNVLRNAILWCDQRTHKQCMDITDAVGADRLIAITANPALTGFTASKILWVRQNQPPIYDECAHILLPKDYLRYRLTGEFATEVSDASGMQLMDVPHRCFSDEILNALHIPKSMLATVYESCQVTGRICAIAAKETGLSEKTLVVGGAGDNAAAAVGSGITEQGKAMTTIGTSGVVYAHTKSPLIDPLGRVHTFCAAVPNEWHVMAVSQAAGLSLRWLKETACINLIEDAKKLGRDVYDLMSDMAGHIPIGAERLLFLPYLMGERTPHLDANCRGTFVGLSAIHTQAHLIRAVMEGVGYSLLDGLCILRQMGIPVSQMTLCGGGARSALWRQMLCDLFACPVTTLQNPESACLGVAILAGVGCGIFSDVQSGVKACVRQDLALAPSQDAEKYLPYYEIYRDLYPAMQKSFGKLSML